MISEHTQDTLGEVILAERAVSLDELVAALGRDPRPENGRLTTSKQLTWLERKGLVRKADGGFVVTVEGLEFAAGWL